MNRIFHVVGLLIAISVAGCGSSGPEMAKVHGTVRIGGVPVANGSVQFWPESGRPARGAIAEDGTYELTTFDHKDGAYVGQHRVTLKSTTLANPGPEIASTEAEIKHFRQKNVKPLRASRVVWVIPRKYSSLDSSTLTATVVSGTNEINFDVEEQ